MTIVVLTVRYKWDRAWSNNPLISANNDLDGLSTVFQTKDNKVQDGVLESETEYKKGLKDGIQKLYREGEFYDQVRKEKTQYENFKFVDVKNDQVSLKPIQG